VAQVEKETRPIPTGGGTLLAVAPTEGRGIQYRIRQVADDKPNLCMQPDLITGKFCGRSTTRSSAAGLSPILCRYHQQHRQRHGSTWCKTPKAKAIEPYLKAALAYLEVNTDDYYVKHSLACIKHSLENAGPVEIATRLRGRPAQERARIALARLRDKGITPSRLLAIAIAVRALLQEADGHFARDPEYRQVAVAKAAHRLASGTHKSWEFHQRDGRVVCTEMHTYPRSSGQVLRHLGEQLEAEAELVIDRHLAGILDLKIARYGKFDPRLAAK
jgi:hypothetical protein